MASGEQGLCSRFVHMCRRRKMGSWKHRLDEMQSLRSPRVRVHPSGGKIRRQNPLSRTRGSLDMRLAIPLPTW